MAAKDAAEKILEAYNDVFADIVNGLMAIPNCVSLIVLSGIVAKETKTYFDKYPIL